VAKWAIRSKKDREEAKAVLTEMMRLLKGHKYLWRPAAIYKEEGGKACGCLVAFVDAAEHKVAAGEDVFGFYPFKNDSPAQRALVQVIGLPKHENPQSMLVSWNDEMSDEGRFLRRKRDIVEATERALELVS
jgi:hypothetical protein